MSVEWGRVRHFRREEWVHDPDLVEPDVVYLLDEQRAAHGVALPGVRYVIHVAWDRPGSHDAGDSSHYTTARPLATAVDYHAEVVRQAGGRRVVEPVPLVDLWLWAERVPWNGVGLYPRWNTPGLHCDLRRLGRDHPNLGKRWWRDGKAYKSFDEAMLRRLLGEKA